MADENWVHRNVARCRKVFLRESNGRARFSRNSIDRTRAGDFIHRIQLHDFAGV